MSIHSIQNAHLPQQTSAQSLKPVTRYENLSPQISKYRQMITHGKDAVNMQDIQKEIHGLPPHIFWALATAGVIAGIFLLTCGASFLTYKGLITLGISHQVSQAAGIFTGLWTLVLSSSSFIYLG